MSPAPQHPTRQQVLRMVRAADAPISVQTLAEALGIHPNTARFHLDALQRQGAIEREPHPAQGGAAGGRRSGAVGRPALRYKPARMSAAAGRTDYRLLARVLVSALARRSDDPSGAALEIGRASGALLLAETDPPSLKGTASRDGVETMIAALDALGFQPEAGHPDSGEIRLRHCPFLESAMEHAEITCPLHLGLLQGAMDALDSPVTATGIEPFAQPDLCLVHLGRRSER